MNRLAIGIFSALLMGIALAGCGGSQTTTATKTDPVARFTTIDELVAAVKGQGIAVESEESLGDIKIEGVDVLETRQVKGPDLLLDIIRVDPSTEKNLSSVSTSEATNMQFYWRKPFVIMIHKAPADVDMMSTLDAVFE